MNQIERIRLRRDIKKGLRSAVKTVIKTARDNDGLTEKEMKRKLKSAIRRKMKAVP